MDSQVVENAVTKCKEDVSCSQGGFLEGNMDSFVGYCGVELIDDHTGVTFPMVVMYPTCARGKAERMGPYSMEVSINAASKEGIPGCKNEWKKDLVTGRMGGHGMMRGGPRCQQQ